MILLASSVGDVIAFAVWATVALVIVRALAVQRVADRRGAHPAPHWRRGRVACHTCGRFVWTDHAWQRPADPLHLYCSPTCVPHPERTSQ